MFSVSMLLIAGAFVLTLANAAGRCPLWVPVLLLTIVLLLGAFPR